MAKDELSTRNISIALNVISMPLKPLYLIMKSLVRLALSFRRTQIVVNYGT
jgi:hypothetical protein